jgi:quercetin dioxygenase-like cupin family protein
MAALLAWGPPSSRHAGALGEEQDPVTYSAGQTFSEPPGTLHLLSWNASSSEPAKLVVFVVTPAGQPSTVPATT